MILRLIACIALVAIFIPATPLAAVAETSEAEMASSAYFVNLKDGDVVKSPLLVKFGVAGMKVAPAETYASGTGHFHLLIDTTLTNEEMQFAIPNDDKHLHFGKGQTETSISLTPGKHTLQIVMGDGKHELHQPPIMSSVITVTVE